MKKIALLLMIAAIISKLLGFTRDVSLSYFYGVSSISDAYLISQTIPSVIFGFISIGISTSFIPIYTQALEDEGIDIANEFMNNLINLFIIICIIIIIFVFLFTKQIVLIFASGFKQELVNLSIKFTRIGIIVIFFSSIVSIFSGFLNINNNYIIPSLIGVPFNIISILFIYLSTKGNILLLSIGSVISVFFELVYLYPFVKKNGYKYKFIFKYNNKYIVTLFNLALPAIIGISVNQINLLIDRTIASNIVLGGVSILNYSGRINSLFQGLFVVPIFTILYPNISKMAANNNIINIRKSISQSIGIVGIFVIPLTIGTMIFSNQIVDILFGRGAFDKEAISLTSGAVFFYSIGMIGFSWREILSRGFYSMKDTKTPTINASISMGLNILLNIFLSKLMGINGLALATSISALLSTILLFISLRKKIESVDGKRLIILIIKVLIASLIMGIFSNYSYSILILYLNKIISLTFSTIIGLIIYFSIIIFMNIDEVMYIRNIVKNKFLNIGIFNKS